MIALFLMVMGGALCWVMMRRGGCVGIGHSEYATHQGRAGQARGDSAEATGYGETHLHGDEQNSCRRREPDVRDLWSEWLAGKKGSHSVETARSGLGRPCPRERVRATSPVQDVVCALSATTPDSEPPSHAAPSAAGRGTPVAVTTAPTSTDSTGQARGAPSEAHPDPLISRDAGECRPGLHARAETLDGMGVLAVGGGGQMLDHPLRRGQWVTDLVAGMLTAGMSKHRVVAIVAPLLRAAASASTGVRRFLPLDEQVRAWHARPLRDEYQYLFLAGVGINVQTASGAEPWEALCVYGITDRNRHEWLDYCIADSESGGQWVALLHGLRRRGLRTDRVELAVMDGTQGLLCALRLIFPAPPRQCCWTNKLRDVAAYLDQNQRERCIQEAARIYQAGSRREALRQFDRWKTDWEPVAPQAVASLEASLELLLTFLSQPEEHWGKIRTTNAIARQFRELRPGARSRPRFASEASADRILYAIFNHAKQGGHSG